MLQQGLPYLQAENIRICMHNLSFLDNLHLRLLLTTFRQYTKLELTNIQSDILIDDNWFEQKRI